MPESMPAATKGEKMTNIASRILLSACALIAATATVPAQAQETVKIGLLMTYTGQFTEPATQMDNGIKLYMKQHGDTVAGKKIEIIRKDTAGAPDAAKRLAQELIVKDNVDVLAGFVITPEAMTVSDLSASTKKLMVVMNAATSIITAKSPYITRSSVTLPQNTEQLGLWAARKGLKRVFTMVSDYAPGHAADKSSIQSACRWPILISPPLCSGPRTPIRMASLSSCPVARSRRRLPRR
jgi:branched-chain amino acid transport system substrate-binding protein